MRLYVLINFVLIKKKSVVPVKQFEGLHVQGQEVLLLVLTGGIHIQDQLVVLLVKQIEGLHVQGQVVILLV